MLATLCGQWAERADDGTVSASRSGTMDFLLLLVLLCVPRLLFCPLLYISNSLRVWVFRTSVLSVRAICLKNTSDISVDYIYKHTLQRWGEGVGRGTQETTHCCAFLIRTWISRERERESLKKKKKMMLVVVVVFAFSFHP